MAQVSFNKNIIINTLNHLGIEFDPDHINRGWMLIRCPLHNDKVMSNAGVNLKSGVISCFSCKQTVSIIKLFMQRRNCTYQFALEQIFNTSSPIFVPTKIQEKEEKKEFINYDFSKYITIRLKPQEFFYTRVRGFTESFCRKFNIVHCVSDIYNDYFLTPIVDKEKNIYTFEARKLKQRETLLRYYLNIDFNNIRRISPEEYFKIERNQEKYRIKGDVIKYKNNGIIISDILYYLLKTKVLYPSKSAVSETIWNINNLDFNSDLWVSEGLGTIPKVYENISENCTSIFGSNISEEQLKYLKKFKKKIILISDNDTAALEMIVKLNREIDNLFISTCEKDDTESDFVENLKSKEIINASQYILNKQFKRGL